MVYNYHSYLTRLVSISLVALRTVAPSVRSLSDSHALYLMVIAVLE